MGGHRLTAGIRGYVRKCVANMGQMKCYACLAPFNTIGDILIVLSCSYKTTDSEVWGYRQEMLNEIKCHSIQCSFEILIQVQL
jgi:hypothetical protein